MTPTPPQQTPLQQTPPPFEPVAVPAPASVIRAIWITYAATSSLPLAMVFPGALDTWTNRHEARPEPIPHSEPTSVPSIDGVPFVSPSPVTRTAPHRSTAGTRVADALYDGTEDTTEMAPDGAPFTFLLPRAWDRLGNGRPDAAGATSWRYADIDGDLGQPLVNLVLRHCPEACTDTQHGWLWSTPSLDRPTPQPSRRSSTTSTVRRSRGNQAGA